MVVSRKTLFLAAGCVSVRALNLSRDSSTVNTEVADEQFLTAKPQELQMLAALQAKRLKFESLDPAEQEMLFASKNGWAWPGDGHKVQAADGMQVVLINTDDSKHGPDFGDRNGTCFSQPGFSKCGNGFDMAECAKSLNDDPKNTPCLVMTVQIDAQMKTKGACKLVTSAPAGGAKQYLGMKVDTASRNAILDVAVAESAAIEWSSDRYYYWPHGSPFPWGPKSWFCNGNLSKAQSDCFFYDQGIASENEFKNASSETEIGDTTGGNNWLMSFKDGKWAQVRCTL